jgi:hypothetical protein
MPLITLDNLSLSFSEKPILNEVSATILKQFCVDTAKHPIGQFFLVI